MKKLLKSEICESMNSKICAKNVEKVKLYGYCSCTIAMLVSQTRAKKKKKRRRNEQKTQNMRLGNAKHFPNTYLTLSSKFWAVQLADLNNHPKKKKGMVKL